MTSGTGTADGFVVPVVLHVWNKYWMSNGQLIGQKVIVFDPNTLQTKNFVSLNTADGTFRPAGIALSNDGSALHIASVGLNEVRTIAPSGAALPYPLGLPWAFEHTGIIWKVTHS
jgi:hypothetical protein